MTRAVDARISVELGENAERRRVLHFAARSREEIQEFAGVLESLATANEDSVGLSRSPLVKLVNISDILLSIALNGEPEFARIKQDSNGVVCLWRCSRENWEL